jgi:hypothetical protein
MGSGGGAGTGRGGAWTDSGGGWEHRVTVCGLGCADGVRRVWNGVVDGWGMDGAWTGTRSLRWWGRRVDGEAMGRSWILHQGAIQSRSRALSIHSRRH